MLVQLLPHLCSAEENHLRMYCQYYMAMGFHTRHTASLKILTLMSLHTHSAPYIKYVGTWATQNARYMPKSPEIPHPWESELKESLTSARGH